METKALNPKENFENHMAKYAEKKGFVFNSQSSVWKKADHYFNHYSETFQACMSYEVFEKLVVKPTEA